MSYKELLEQKFQNYLKEPATEFGFSIYEQQSYESAGALIALKNDDLKIRLNNDRGIIDFEIAPLYGEEIFFDAQLLASFFSLKQNSNQLSKMERKRIINNRIGLHDQVSMLTSNYDELKELFSENNFNRTLKTLEELGKERFNNMFE